MQMNIDGLEKVAEFTNGSFVVRSVHSDDPRNLLVERTNDGDVTISLRENDVVSDSVDGSVLNIEKCTDALQDRFIRAMGFMHLDAHEAEVAYTEADTAMIERGFNVFSVTDGFHKWIRDRMDSQQVICSAQIEHLSQWKEVDSRQIVIESSEGGLPALSDDPCLFMHLHRSGGRAIFPADTLDTILRLLDTNQIPEHVAIPGVECLTRLLRIPQGKPFH